MLGHELLHARTRLLWLSKALQQMLSKRTMLWQQRPAPAKAWAVAIGGGFIFSVLIVSIASGGDKDGPLAGRHRIPSHAKLNVGGCTALL